MAALITHDWFLAKGSTQQLFSGSKWQMVEHTQYVLNIYHTGHQMDKEEKE